MRRQVFNDEIANRWKNEALNSGRDVTQSMMDWIIAELRYKATVFKEKGIVTVYNGNVVKSDTAVPESSRQSLMDAVRVLEAEQNKDFHPGSNDQVVDLVHPSLFPLVYGRSRVLRDETINLDDCMLRIGHGKVIPAPDSPQPDGDRAQRERSIWWRFPRTTAKSYSTKFQWLPCDVELGDSGCRITSYINNLHPRRHRPLYAAVEEVINRAIPLWDATLTPIDPRYREFYRKRRISYHNVAYPPYPEDERPSDEDEEWEWESQHRLKTTVLPEPGTFTPPTNPQPSLDIRSDFSRLQVIVKLATIELTPEKPSYPGGSWHVEGQLNEHICTTALYYYSNENITPSTLHFRQESFWNRDVFSVENDEHEWLTAVFGMEQGGPQVQNVGAVVCNEGRLLTFPNTLQHRVGRFSLKDKSKPGHRKIMALFLVDPNIRVISTANVPPQRRDWFAEEMYRVRALGEKLPVELQEQIINDADFMDLEEAKELRLELMDERRTFGREQTTMFESLTWSLCEH